MATPLPSNQAQFSPHDVVAATDGTLQHNAGHLAVGVSTDTRTLQPGNAFVALFGPSYDGHDHVEQACQQGASLLLVSRPVPAPRHVSVVVVPDTRRALGRLGWAHRRRWSARGAEANRTVIAVAGSAGKTTTRRAIACLLKGLGSRVHYATGNFNNAIGIPLVLLGLEAHHDTAVIEIGTSEPGEVSYGASIVEPEVGVLTLVAMEHSEGLGNLDEIAEEEGCLLASLGPRATAIVNGDDPRCVAQLLRSPASNWLLYGKQRQADVRVALRSSNGLRGGRLAVTLRNQGLRGVRVRQAETSLSVDTPLLGEAGAYATVAAIAVAGILFPGQLTAERITDGLAPLADERDAGRLVPYELPDTTVVLDDSYNANTASMRAGIATAVEIAMHFGRRLVLVLGEMRELGNFSVGEHEKVGEIAAAARPAEVIAVGGDALQIAKTVRAQGGHASFADDAAAAVPYVLHAVQAGDVVLVKGSRGVRLDTVVQQIRDTHSSTP